MSDILKYFPGDPRPIQADILEEVARVWNQADVIAISAKVATGKSRIAVTIGQASDQPTVITTPTRVLVEQYKADFPDLHWLGRKSDYVTDRQFYRAKNTFTHSQLAISNYHAICANKLQKPVMVVDEAHNVLSLHQDRHAFHIWKDDYFWPDDLETLGDAFQWLETARFPKLEKVMEEIKNTGNYVLELSPAFRRGQYHECLKFIPLTIKDKSPWLWNNSVDKLVLMSATINKKDLEELGLDRRRCCVIESDSPIPEENRPVVFEPIAPMGFDVKSEGIKLIAARVDEIARSSPGKGILHATYDVASRLRVLLKSDRYMFHHKGNRQAVYEKFLRSEGKILVGSGFSEGIDLKGDRAEWQCILQVPYPNLQDLAIEQKAQDDPDWYSWQTVKTLLQTFGRVCRAPDDYGVTYILDSNFGYFYKKNKDLFPMSIINA